MLEDEIKKDIIKGNQIGAFSKILDYYRLHPEFNPDPLCKYLGERMAKEIRSTLSNGLPSASYNFH